MAVQRQMKRLLRLVWSVVKWMVDKALNVKKKKVEDKSTSSGNKGVLPKGIQKGNIK